MGLESLLSAAASGASAYAGAQGQKDAIEGSIPQQTTLSMDPSEAQAAFGRQGAMLQQIADMLNKTTDLDNSNFQDQVLGLDPQLAGNIGGVDSLAAQFARGYVDPETAAAIKRQTAYGALQGGYAGSGMADANYQVQLGKQALTEQELSPQLQGEAMNQSLALNPTHTDVGSTLLSPAAILQRSDAQDYYNRQLQNQFATASAAMAAKKGGSSGGAGGLGSLMSMFGSSGGGGGSGLGSLMSSFGSGGGG